MTDTPSAIERMVREKIMARSGAERFVMGARMFDAAREMILASFPPDLPKEEKQRRLFARLYGETPSLGIVRETADKKYRAKQ
jgi:hypothetical protein